MVEESTRDHHAVHQKIDVDQEDDAKRQLCPKTNSHSQAHLDKRHATARHIGRAIEQVHKTWLMDSTKEWHLWQLGLWPKTAARVPTVRPLWATIYMKKLVRQEMVLPHRSLQKERRKRFVRPACSQTLVIVGCSACCWIRMSTNRGEILKEGDLIPRWRRPKKFTRVPWKLS